VTERREYQRLNLSSPLDGWFGDYDVRLVDVSATGASIESTEDIPSGSRALLRFYWHGEEIEVTAEVARVEGRVGLRFVEDSQELRIAIAQSAQDVLRAQQANALGMRASNLLEGDQTLTAASAAVRGAMQTFIVFRLTPEGWNRRHSLVPEQPHDGFAVSANESDEQIALLCQTYEAGDEDARKMTRMLAELSVAGTMDT
jgi:hypothetical protein